MSTPLLGTTFAIEVDSTTAVATNTRGTEANYKLLACLTSNGVQMNIAEQDTSNKCDGGNATSIPGLLDWSISGDGQAASLETGEAAVKTNYQAIMTLAKNKTVFFARITDPTSTVVREGKVYITSYAETQGNNEVYSFTVSMKGVGELFILPVAP